MDSSARKRSIGAIKANHKAYIRAIGPSANSRSLQYRFARLAHQLQTLLRKYGGSSNSLKPIPNLARLIFGLHEDLQRLNLPSYDSQRERTILNHYVIDALTLRLRSKYSGECKSHGEALLNCYLDAFLTFTVLKTSKEIGVKPHFLVNPLTGAILELDVLFEDFRLAFEFQGEHHYTDAKVQGKDAFKLSELPKHLRVLIPVNVSQLHGETLGCLILNSVMDHLALRELMASRDPRKLPAAVPPKQLRQFCKAAHRIHLAEIVFEQTHEWLDSEAQAYIAGQTHRQPVTATTPAPRFVAGGHDLTVEYIYKNLKYVTTGRRLGRRSP
ncbi:MAG: hypothetical protein ABSA12_02295 [Verrucomicrobiia bacterium]